MSYVPSPSTPTRSPSALREGCVESLPVLLNELSGTLSSGTLTCSTSRWRELILLYHRIKRRATFNFTINSSVSFDWREKVADTLDRQIGTDPSRRRVPSDLCMPKSSIAIRQTSNPIVNRMPVSCYHELVRPKGWGRSKCFTAYAIDTTLGVGKVQFSMSSNRVRH